MPKKNVVDIETTPIPGGGSKTKVTVKPSKSGAIAGASAGAAIGTAVAGPAGAAVGAAVGGAVGYIFGPAD